MKKFITLQGAFERINEAKRGGGFPDTHAKYMSKYFPDEEEAPEDGENVNWQQVEDEHNPSDVDRNNPAYSTKFADDLYSKMYPKQKTSSSRLTPAEVYQNMSAPEDTEDHDRSPHDMPARPNPRIAFRWSDEAKSLYTMMANGTVDSTTFEIDKAQSDIYSAIPSPELGEVLDQALDNNLDISNSVWDLMQSKNKKIYKELRKSVGIGEDGQPLPTKPDDFELFNILKKHPDHTGRKGVKYKPNAGSYKLKDLKKRIRAKYGADAEDKIADLTGFINQNRRFPNK